MYRRQKQLSLKWYFSDIFRTPGFVYNGIYLWKHFVMCIWFSCGLGFFLYKREKGLGGDRHRCEHYRELMLPLGAEQYINPV